ncbi:MAG: ABC transporter permease [Clostridiales bacterium]|nr:ABC transporter permease [Clostridiales bacterium]
MIFKTIGSAFKQAFKQVFRNRAMTLASLFSITAMLLILGIFFVLVVNISMVTESAKAQFDVIQVYLEDEVDAARSVELMQRFKAMDQVASVEYITKDQAMAEFKVKWGDNAYLLDGLTDNPLPNSLRITVSDLATADQVANTAKNLAGVEDIKYYQETVETLMKITDSIEVAAMVIIVFLVVVSVVVVSNTIKLTVTARADEITIMKYVGATNWYIRAPFLFEGMIIGFLSAAISVAAVAAIYHNLVGLLEREMLVLFSSSLVPADFLIGNLVWIFMALGICIGASGSIVSMRRFLDT